MSNCRDNLEFDLFHYVIFILTGWMQFCQPEGCREIHDSVSVFLPELQAFLWPSIAESWKWSWPKPLSKSNTRSLYWSLFLCVLSWMSLCLLFWLHTTAVKSNRCPHTFIGTFYKCLLPSQTAKCTKQERVHSTSCFSISQTTVTTWWIPAISQWSTMVRTPSLCL